MSSMIPLTKRQKATLRAIRSERIKRKSMTSRRNKAGPRRPARPFKNGPSRRGEGRVLIKGSTLPAAVSIKGMRVGLSDVMGHSISWIAGYVYVGNGTLGTAANVFYQSADGAYVFTNPVPILPSQTTAPAVGASYCADIEKHYARKRIKKMKLTLLPLFPSTSNSMTVVAAAIRGGSNAFDTVASTSSSATAIPYTNVLSMTGSKQCASWEPLELDLTPYIAGGSGANQNEFAISSTIASNTPAQEGNQLVPSCIAFAGNCSTSALNGTKTHAIVISQIVDLLDFTGGIVPVDPVGIDLDNKESFQPFNNNNSSISKQIDLDEEYQSFLAFKEHHAKLHEIKESSENDDDYTSVPTTTISNSIVKLNPRALEFKPGKLSHAFLGNEECALPKSESFISQVKELITARADRK